MALPRVTGTTPPKTPPAAAQKALASDIKTTTQTAAQKNAAAQAAAIAQTRAADEAQNKAITQIKTGQIVVAPPVKNPLPETPKDTTTKPDPKPIPDPTPQPTPEAIDKSSGLVDGVNFKQQYFDAIKELTLSLINSAKGLLGKYNFSTIDRVPEYYLDIDREAQPTAVISMPVRPNPPFGPVDADYQDKFSLDVNEISNQISDLSEDTTRSAYFGTLNGDTFTAGEMKIMNGNSYYDMRLVFNSISSQQNFVIKCYEI